VTNPTKDYVTPRLTDVGPNCGGSVDETNVPQQFQVEIPSPSILRQINTCVCECRPEGTGRRSEANRKVTAK